MLISTRPQVLIKQTVAKLFIKINTPTGAISSEHQLQLAAPRLAPEKTDTPLLTEGTSKSAKPLVIKHPLSTPRLRTLVLLHKLAAQAISAWLQVAPTPPLGKITVAGYTQVLHGHSRRLHTLTVVRKSRTITSLGTLRLNTLVDTLVPQAEPLTSVPTTSTHPKGSTAAMKTTAKRGSSKGLRNLLRLKLAVIPLKITAGLTALPLAAPTPLSRLTTRTFVAGLQAHTTKPVATTTSPKVTPPTKQAVVTLQRSKMKIIQQGNGVMWHRIFLMAQAAIVQ